MSTKTLGPLGPIEPGAGDKLLLFIVLSLVIHAGVLGGFLTLVPDVPERKDTSPIVVDILRPPGPNPKVAVIDRDVVELPPESVTDTAEKKPPSFYADRDQSVEKQTVPGAVPSDRIDPTTGAPAAVAVKPSPPSPPPSPPSRSGPVAPVKAPGAKVTPAPEATDSDGEIVAAPSAPPAVSKGMEGAKGAEGAGARPADRPAPENLKLFPTEERLSQLSREYERHTPRGERGKTLRLNTSELKYQSYILNMKRRIELRWQYPEVAVANGWQGILLMDFSINKDGTLASVKVKKSSGYPVLDDAAVTALRLAGPYPPFPEDFLVEKISIKAQFEYLIRFRPGPAR